MFLAIFNIVPEVLIVNFLDRPCNQIVVNVAEIREGFSSGGFRDKILFLHDFIVEWLLDEGFVDHLLLLSSSRSVDLVKIKFLHFRQVSGLMMYTLNLGRDFLLFFWLFQIKIKILHAIQAEVIAFLGSFVLKLCEV